MVGNGHSPEHACFYCPELQLFISGDQVLPRISSNVSVHPTETDGDPLRDQLIEGHERNLEKLEDTLSKPQRVVDVFGSLFARPITGAILGMATGEAVAHSIIFGEPVESSGRLINTGFGGGAVHATEYLLSFSAERCSGSKFRPSADCHQMKRSRNPRTAF